MVTAIGQETVGVLRKEVSVRRALQQTPHPVDSTLTVVRMVTVPRG